MTGPGPAAAGAVVAIGARRDVGALTLAGAEVRLADTPDEVRGAWSALGPGVALVILGPAAAAALGDLVDALDAPLTAVMPR
ncbi:hypothetical protein [Demequina rhizosphaerae]|uniref:hypothetical protein n=1 Tax=Demequina rhizosphaerae TaxID=1638985 RepID=UPI000785090B|nr:hypothetical protein [Demequina rhizosphaerae]